MMRIVNLFSFFCTFYQNFRFRQFLSYNQNSPLREKQVEYMTKFDYRANFRPILAR